MSNSTSIKIVIVLVLCVTPGLQAGNSPFEVLMGQRLVSNKLPMSAQSVLMTDAALNRVQKAATPINTSCLHIQGLQQKKPCPSPNAF